MKTHVTIPDDVFKQVEHLARKTGRSRSAIYSAALNEYLSRHDPDAMTEAINRVCDVLSDQTLDPFVAEAARRIL